MRWTKRVRLISYLLPWKLYSHPHMLLLLLNFQAAAFLADECYGDEWVYALFLVLDAVMQLGWLALHPSACLEYLRPDQACFGTGHAVHFCITQHLIQHCTFVSSCFIFLPFLVAISSPIWKE